MGVRVHHSEDEEQWVRVHHEKKRAMGVRVHHSKDKQQWVRVHHEKKKSNGGESSP